jgi:hypothetical protein
MAMMPVTVVIHAVHHGVVWSAVARVQWPWILWVTAISAGVAALESTWLLVRLPRRAAPRRPRRSPPPDDPPDA